MKIAKEHCSRTTRIVEQLHGQQSPSSPLGIRLEAGLAGVGVEKETATEKAIAARGQLLSR